VSVKGQANFVPYCLCPLPCLFSEALRSSLRDACLDCLGNSLTTFFRILPPDGLSLTVAAQQVRGILPSGGFEGRILMPVFRLLSPPLTNMRSLLDLTISVSVRGKDIRYLQQNYSALTDKCEETFKSIPHYH
jgi:hypothetical protein